MDATPVSNLAPYEQTVQEEQCSSDIEQHESLHVNHLQQRASSREVLWEHALAASDLVH